MVFNNDVNPQSSPSPQDSNILPALPRGDRYIKIDRSAQNILKFFNPSISYSFGIPELTPYAIKGETYVRVSDLASQHFSTDFSQDPSNFDCPQFTKELELKHKALCKEAEDLVQVHNDLKKVSLSNFLDKKPPEVLGLAALYSDHIFGRPTHDLLCLLLAEKALANGDPAKIQAIETEYAVFSPTFAKVTLTSFPIIHQNKHSKGELAFSFTHNLLLNKTFQRKNIYAYIEKHQLLESLSDVQMGDLFNQLNYASFTQDLRAIVHILAKNPPRKISINPLKAGSDPIVTKALYADLRKVAYVNEEPLIKSAKESAEYQLNLKSFALFAGDSFIENMKDERKNKYESSRTDITGEFVISALDYFLEEHLASLPELDKQKIVDAKHNILEAVNYEEKLDALRFKTGFPEELYEAIKNLHKDVAEQLNQGTKVLLPLGWLKAGDGHSILVEMKLSSDGNSYEMFVFNTGQGVEHHDRQYLAPRRRGDTCRVYRIPIPNFNDEFFSHLIEPVVTGGRPRDIIGNLEEYGPLDFYPNLQKYTIPTDPALSNWMKLQFSGTCSMRALLAYLHKALGSELYDHFKRFIKHEGTLGLIAKDEKKLLFERSVELDPNFVRALGFTFQDLYRHFIKEIQAGTVTDTKITNWLNRLNQIELSKRQLESLVAESRYVSKVPDSQQGIAELSLNQKPLKLTENISDIQLIPESAPSILQPNSINHAQNCQSIDDFLNLLNLASGQDGILEYVSVVKELFQLVKTNQLDRLCSASTPKDVKKLINLLAQRTRMFNSMLISGSVYPASSFIILNMSLFVAYHLVCNTESRLLLPSELKILTFNVSYSLLHQELDTFYTNSEWMIARETIREERSLSSLGCLFFFIQYKSKGDTKEPQLHLPAPEVELYYAWSQANATVKQYVEMKYEEARISSVSNFDRKQWIATFVFTNRDIIVDEVCQMEFKKASTNLTFEDWKKDFLADDAIHLPPTYLKELFDLAMICRLAIPGKELLSTPPDYKLSQPIIIKPRAENSFNADVGFFANGGGVYSWTDALLLNPERFGIEAAGSKPFQQLTLPKASGDLLSVEQSIENPLKSIVHSKPVRNVKDDYNNFHVDFEPSTANFLEQSKAYSTSNKQILSFWSWLENIEKRVDRLQEPEFQAVVMSELNKKTDALLSILQKNPEKVSQKYDAFFKKMLAHYEGVLATNIYNGSSLRTVYFLLEWQIRVSNLFIASGYPGRSFDQNINKRLETLSKNPLNNSQKEFGKYWHELRIVSLEHITTNSPFIPTFITSTFALKLLKDVECKIASRAFGEMASELANTKLFQVDRFFEQGGPLVEETLKELLRLTGVIVHQALVHEKVRGTITFVIGNNHYSYDIALYQFTINGSKNYEYKPTAITRRAFGDRVPTHARLIRTGNNQIIFAQDGDELVRIDSISTMKQMNAKVLGYANPRNARVYDYKPVNALNFSAEIWETSDQNSKSLIYVDPANNKILAEILPNGVKLVEYPHRLFTPRQSFVSAFHPESFVLTEQTTRDNPKSLLIIPNYQTKEGSLTFEFKADKNGTLRWINKNNPNQWICKDQQNDSISKKVLIVENEVGDRFALVPMEPLKEDMVSKETLYRRIDVMEIPLKGVALAPQKIAQALLLAYTTLQNARLPKDYQKALSYLSDFVNFAPLKPDEYKLLAWIILSRKETEDHSIFAHVVRLYALWIVEDNNRKFDVIVGDENLKEGETPSFFAASKRFVSYLNSPPIFNDLKKKFVKEYHQKQKNLPQNMRLESLLSSAEIGEFLYVCIDKKVVRDSLPYFFQRKFFDKCVAENFEKLKKLIAASDGVPAYPLYLHPSTKELCSHFAQLYDDAVSRDLVARQRFVDALQAMINDSNPENMYLRLILYEAYQSGSSPLGLELMKKDSRLSQQESVIAFDILKQTIGKNGFADGDPEFISNALPEHPKVEVGQDTLLLSYSEGTERYSLETLHELYREHFKLEKPKKVGHVERFEIADDRDYIQRGFQDLNQDVLIGAQKNAEIPKHAFQGDVRQLRRSVEIEQGILQGSLSTLEQVILKLANSGNVSKEQHIRRAVKEGTGEAHPLSMDDLKAMFLHGNQKEYERELHLDVKKIQSLDYYIGQYLLLSRKNNHMENILQDIDAGSIEKAGEKLRISQNYTPSESTRAYVVFEEALGLYLKKDQVEALERLIPKGEKVDKVLLQRIQGAGKSLVFGHLLALLKADGEHLSVHVVPTPQFATAIYDMERLSKRVFKQKERVLEYSDNDKHNTDDYMRYFMATLVGAIKNREYVTMTKETLLALRDRFIKSCDVNDESEVSRYLLEILSLLSTNGIFTFDEAHLAFDPNKELNMPTGKVSKMNIQRATLMREIVMLSRNNPIESIANKLLENQTIRRSFGIHDKITKAKVRDYLNGLAVELPEFLKELNQKGSEAATLVEITRQMLLKGVFSSLQRQNIQEDYGFPLNPRVIQTAVPYIANMIPAAGSEFSDSLVMMTNTFFVYATLGIQLEQTKPFIEYLRRQCIKEWLNKTGENPDATFEESPLAQLTHQYFKEDIRGIDLEDPKKMQAFHEVIQCNRELFLPLVMRFAQDDVIGAVNLYEWQISSNGQNAASMAKSFVAYTASMENPNMAPVGTKIIADEGTNGQTIDLFLSKKMACLQMDRSPTEIVKLIKSNLNISAIIDAGCHFKGLTNDQAAKLIAQGLPEHKKGVLFFDKEGNLSFLAKGKEEPVVLSGTNPTIIAKETGLTLEQLFTYYDQVHITGVDLLQHAKAEAIVTCGENTRLHELLQGGRRLRDLANQQRLTFVIDREGVKEASYSLKMDQKAIGLKEMIAFTWLNEIEAAREQNLLFVLQKIEDSMQKIFLNKMLNNTLQKKTILASVRPLFVKSTAIDYVKTFATKRANVGIETFLRHYANQLYKDYGKFLPKVEQDSWSVQMDNLIKQALPGLQKEIELSRDYQSNPIEPVQNQGKTQIRQQEVVSEQKVTVEQIQNVSNRTIIPIEPLQSDEMFGVIDLVNFPRVYPRREPRSSHGTWRVTDLIRYESWKRKDDSPDVAKDRYSGLFDKDIVVTDGIFKVFDGAPSFMTTPKECAGFAAFCKQGEWTVVGLTAEDFVQLSRHALFNDYSAFLMTPLGNSISNPDYDPSIRFKIAQLMFAMGDLRALDTPKLLTAFKEWALSNKRTAQVAQYFREEIKGKRPGLEGTAAYAFLDTLS